MTKLKVAAIQLNASNDKESNLLRAATLIKEASLSKASFVALPETFNFRGDRDASIAQAEDLETGPSTQMLIQLARAHKIWISNGSIFTKANGNGLPFNTSLLINPDGDIIAHYNKIHLFDVEIDGKEIKESSKTQAGGKPVTASLIYEGAKISFALSICYDLRFPELYRDYAKNRMQIILVPSAFTKRTGEAHWHTLCRARAIENQAFVIAANQCGIGSAVETYGHSLIVDPWGKVIAEASADREEIIYADLDFDLLASVRKNLPCLEHRKL